MATVLKCFTILHAEGHFLINYSCWALTQQALVINIFKPFLYGLLLQKCSKSFKTKYPYVATQWQVGTENTYTHFASDFQLSSLNVAINKLHRIVYPRKRSTLSTEMARQHSEEAKLLSEFTPKWCSIMIGAFPLAPGEPASFRTPIELKVFQTISLCMKLLDPQLSPGRLMNVNGDNTRVGRYSLRGFQLEIGHHFHWVHNSLFRPAKRCKLQRI